MGIYISEINMPDEENKLVLQIFPNGEVYDEHGIRLGIKNWAEAVPVPPHGRLIDASKIGLTDFEIILCQKGNPFKNALEMLLEKIEKAPTIIPADPPKEETC